MLGFLNDIKTSLDKTKHDIDDSYIVLASLQISDIMLLAEKC